MDFEVEMNKTDNGYELFISEENASGLEYEVKTLDEAAQIVYDFIISKGEL